MDIQTDLLDLSVGLKFNHEVVLGKQNVISFIESHKEYYQNLQLKSIKDSHMKYGYDSAGNPVKLGFKGKYIQRIVTVTKPLKYQRYQIIMSYDGSRYSGFQIQDNQMTIQGELTKAVSSINGVQTLVQGASRTDAGVHALMYVSHFDATNVLTPDKWKTLLNYQLPKDIRVQEVNPVHPLFHSRYDVYKKEYLYKIRIGEKNPFKINYEWQIDSLNVERLIEQTKQVIGTHDFSSFCKGTPDSTVRTMFDVEVKQKQNELHLVFVGDGFLRYMIRIMVYTLVEIANEKLQVDILDIIKEKSREHTKHLAPASGLYLQKLIY